MCCFRNFWTHCPALPSIQTPPPASEQTGCVVSIALRQVSVAVAGGEAGNSFAAASWDRSLPGRPGLLLKRSALPTASARPQPPSARFGPAGRCCPPNRLPTAGHRFCTHSRNLRSAPLPLKRTPAGGRAGRGVRQRSSWAWGRRWGHGPLGWPRSFAFAGGFADTSGPRGWRQVRAEGHSTLPPPPCQKNGDSRLWTMDTATRRRVRHARCV